MELKDVLRKLRLHYRYYQRELAEYLEIDRSTYAYYESGKATPPLDTLLQLSDLYGVTLDFLVGREWAVLGSCTKREKQEGE
ncbi:helix-turn-helix transcriptional regulator [Clostridium sp. D33t1_170424_F3]|uniref:helix-turn-helix transcriptional regulator n=1 Tax=Clostridium sp. D33t1_170424_F3 TaxID=2787099 RepID=UPI0018A97846|nr:helix-turn-helix transcriptional regulator [Clostridium sp. D33t1_170424_F3]